MASCFVLCGQVINWRRWGVTAEELGAVAGVVLSLMFSYVPGVREKWDALEGTVKRLVMAGLLALTALVIYGLACSGIAELAGLVGGITCDASGVVALVRVFVTALVVNQATYQISPKV
jgi:hypothetical protein